MATRSEQFAALVREQPGNSLFRFSLAQALVQENRPLEAIPHFETCVASRADWMMPRILLGKLLLQAGRKAEAQPILAGVGLMRLRLGLGPWRRRLTSMSAARI